MRSGGMLTIALALIVACDGIPARAQDVVHSEDVAPWSTDSSPDNSSILPKRLTLRDAEKLLSENDITPAQKSKLSSDENDDDKDNADQSALEKMYSDRVNVDVTQFGYDMFATPRGKHDDQLKTPNGSVQDDYILSVGDELNAVIRGQRQDNQTTTITSEGMLIVQDIDPIPAAGRRLGDVREQLKNEVAKLYNTDVFLSLNHVAQVNVIVAGHVKHPGRQTLTSFDTVLDALMSAGGVEKTGTLRQIRLIRDGKTMLIDLYGLLVFGSDGVDISLRNGDKIIVRPIGPSIAVTGDVKREGIYEILPALKANWDRPEEKSQKLSMNDLLAMSGGVMSPAAHRFLRMDINNRGEENVAEVKEPLDRIFSDGDILNIARGKETREGTVELVGNANQSGTHSLSETETLSALLYDDSVVGPETYPLIGVIEHWDKKEMAKELVAFCPKRVLNGEEDRKLENGDSVYLFSQKQIEKLKNPDPHTELIDASMVPDEKTPDKTDRITGEIKKFLIERSVFVRGAVRSPGAYPVADNVTLDTVLAVTGGATLEGDAQSIEISSDRKGAHRDTIDLSKTDAHTIKLSAGDTIRVNQRFRRVEDNHVLLIGEVQNPGTYDLQPGDTLGKLLARAGNLTNDAYPNGAIFSRASERKREETRFKSEAQDLELRLASMIEQTDKDKKPDPENVAIAKDLISQLKQTEALGRITVEADPSMLKSQPQLDILLESGDRIYIPKRPLTVRVAGEVLSPAALQFRTEKTARDYLNEAGGLSYNADDSRAFVVYPNGSAQPLAVTAWNHSAIFIPPGSTIIVPRDPKPLSFIDGAKDISQILANVATAAIFADDVRNNR